MEEKIIALEEKIAYQDQAIEVLSDRLFQQQKEVDVLATRLAQLLELLSSNKQLLSEKEGEKTLLDSQERPPHY